MVDVVLTSSITTFLLSADMIDDVDNPWLCITSVLDPCDARVLNILFNFLIVKNLIELQILIYSINNMCFIELTYYLNIYNWRRNTKISGL